MFLLFVTGCSPLQIATSKATEMALNAVGIKLPENSNSSPPKVVNLHIQADKNMNANTNGEGLSAILRLYKLKDQNNFLVTPYSVFGQPDKEKQTLENDLVEVKELILSPGQTLDLKEKMGADASYLGIVTLFRSPSAQRWRFSFATADAQKSVVSIGIHACAMTAASIAPAGLTLNESSLKPSTRCQ